MTDEPVQPEQPRRDIASSTVRALRAARATTPPTPPPAVEDDAAVEADVVAADAVEDDIAVADAAEDDVVAEPDSEDDVDVVAEPGSEDDADVVAEAEPAAEPDVEPEAVAEPQPADASDLADDVPPVLAAKPPRDSKRTSVRTEARSTPAARRRPRRTTLITAAIAAAALVFGIISGVVWWRADHDSDRTVATARDDVAVDARIAIATVNTSDYRKPDAALRNWIAVSAGSLKSQFTDQRKSATTLLGQSKMITSATVLDAAVTKLDTAKGSATVIASVNLKRKPVTGAASTTRNRFRATLTRQGDDWKLADLALVSVQLT